MKGLLDLTRGGAWNHVGRKHRKYHMRCIRNIKETTLHRSSSANYKKHARAFRCILEDSHITAALGRKKMLAAKKNLDRHIHNLINRLKGEKDKHCKKMFKRLRREKDYSFTFLEVDGMD